MNSDFVSIVAEIGNNADKIDLRYNSKPVADATGYKNITLPGFRFL